MHIVCMQSGSLLLTPPHHEQYPLPLRRLPQLQSGRQRRARGSSPLRQPAAAAAAVAAVCASRSWLRFRPPVPLHRRSQEWEPA